MKDLDLQIHSTLVLLMMRCWYGENTRLRRRDVVIRCLYVSKQNCDVSALTVFPTIERYRERFFATTSAAD